jgi:hypothetical protein
MSKKLISAALTATTFAWAVSVAFVPVASAQSTTDLQSQIAALLAQIQQLQGQLNATSGTTTTSASTGYSFTQDLTLGSTGADVTALQNLLIKAGDLNITTATTYFGALTQAALAKYQAANGISPAAGYFGPKTRAYVNSLNVSTSTTTTTTTGGGGTTTTTTGTTTTTTTGTTGVVAPASGLAVSVSSANPGVGSLISTQQGCTGTCYGAARVPVLSVNFTAGNSGAVTVSAVNFHKVGVLSDSSVSGAYLTQNGKVLYQYNSLNQGVLSFSGMSLNVPAGQTVTLTLAIDVAGGLSSGNTVSFSVNAATDVTAFDTNNNALTAAGTFPVNGNTFTVTNVSNPNLASVDVELSTVGSQVTAGTQNNLVGAWTLSPQNSKVWLEGINFHVIGSANKGDIRNVKLMVNGTQVGATLPTVNQDGTAFFDTSATPGVLNTGSNNVQVFADIMGSPSYNFQFEILNGYDVNAVDSQYDVPVVAYSTNGFNGSGLNTNTVTIQAGQITTTLDSNTPTGNIAKGQSSITLAKFDVYAAGEAVKIQYLPFSLVFTDVNDTAHGATATTTLTNLVQNVSIVDDAGGQVGTTINQPPSMNVIPAGTTFAIPALAGGSSVTYTDSFGTSGSPINYTIPANTTRVLSLRADIQSTANFGTVTGNLVTPVGNNLQGLISSKQAQTTGAQGSALTLALSSLAVTQNNALGAQTVSAGTANLNIGAYSFTASSAEGVNVNNVSVTLSPNGPGLSQNAASTVFQNLKIMVNGVQFGTTFGTLTQGGKYTFSGTPFNVPEGSTVNVQVYADTLSSATTTTELSPATQLSGFTGTGMISNSAVSLVGSPISGQALGLAGTATIQVAADSSQVPAGQIVMGSVGNSLATFRFTETSNVDNVKVTALTVNDNVSSTASGVPKAAFSNLTLWNGSTNLGTAGSAVLQTPTSSGSAVYTYTFNSFNTPLIVPKANSISLTLKGDAATYSSNGATDNSTNTFLVASTTSLTALGQTSNKVTTVSSVAGASGNLQTVLRSNLTVATAAAGGYSHSKGTPDVLGTVTFTSNSQGPVNLKKLAITFTGSALLYSTSSGNFLGGSGPYTNVPAVTATITVVQPTQTSTYTAVIDGVTFTGPVEAPTTLPATIASDLNSVIAAGLSAGTVSGFTTSLSGAVITLTAADGLTHTLTTTVSGAGAADSASRATFYAAGVQTATSTNIQLIDQNGGNVVNGEATQYITFVSSSTPSPAVVTWVFNNASTTGGGFEITPSGYTFTLKVNDSAIPSVANVGQSLSANIQNQGDVTYWDALDGSATSINSLPIAVIGTLNINNISYPTGQ